MADLLTDIEVRVLGSLIEKEMTTPDYYPLSLNALTTACNQTTNREPVVSYDEHTVAHAIESLRVRSLVRAVQQSGSRVTKYRHLANETLNLTDRYTALLGVLMLRGPQTSAELRARASRYTPFESLEDVEAALDALIDRQPTPLVARLPRRSGQKETRYAHLLAGEVTYDVPDADSDDRAADGEGRSMRGSAQADRIAALESAMEEVRREIVELRGQLDAFRRQFE